MRSNFPPVIKWSGSKRLQAPTIVKFFPSFSTYYEPFVGGGSVMFQASPKKAICADICAPLIELWKLVKSSPDEVTDSYKTNWMKLQTQGYTYYYELRERYNANRDPHDLLFLSRTCVNGLIRFNGQGQFNNSLHYTRKGIDPMTMGTILHAWSARVKNVEFVQGDYRDTTRTATEKDFVYLDPPYFNTKGRYYGRIDFPKFVEYLLELKEKGVKFALSFDGRRGSEEFFVDFPSGIFGRRFLINNGNSTFIKVMGQRVESVQESLYLSWMDPESDLSDYSSNAGESSLSSSEANLVVLNSSE